MPDSTVSRQKLMFFFFLKSIPAQAAKQTPLLLVAVLLGNQYPSRALDPNVREVDYANQGKLSGVINTGHSSGGPAAAAGSDTSVSVEDMSVFSAPQ